MAVDELKSDPWRWFDRLVDIGVYHVNRDSCIERCNAAFARFFHNDPIHMIGCDVMEITAVDFRDEARRSYGMLLSGKAEQVHHKKVFVRQDGSHFERTINAVRTFDGDVISFAYESADDTSERQLLVESLEALSRTQSVNIKMTNADQSNTASHGSQIMQTSGNVLLFSSLIIGLSVMVIVIWLHVSQRG